MINKSGRRKINIYIYLHYLISIHKKKLYLTKHLQNNIFFIYLHIFLSIRLFNFLHLVGYLTLKGLKESLKSQSVNSHRNIKRKSKQLAAKHKISKCILVNK